MLFSSTEFVFAFLPAVVLGFFLIAAQGKHQLAILWLIGASLFFYGWWRPEYLVLLVGSISVNYAIGRALQKNARKQILAVGVVFNLGLIQEQLGNKAAAFEFFLRSVELKPNYQDVRIALAKAYEEQGNIDQAKTQYQYVLDNISPADTVSKENLERLNSHQ